MIRKLYPGGKPKAFSITYDDGVLQDIPLVSLLNRYGLKGTFNLNSGGFSKPDMLIRNGRRVAHYKVAAKSVWFIILSTTIGSFTAPPNQIIGICVNSPPLSIVP